MQTFAPHFLLLQDAEGAIEAHDAQQERLDEFTQRLANGEFHIHTTGEIPCKCKDGRSCDDSTEGPNAAGGTESIYVADDLTTKRFAAADDSTVAGMRNTIEFLKSKHLAVGGHGDSTNHGSADNSGCGANDKLREIYEMIGRKPEAIKSIAETIMSIKNIDDDTNNLIINNAKQRTKFSNGREIISVLQSTGDAHLEELQGTHKESVAVYNLKQGTTLDRRAIELKFGKDFQAFNTDVWSFLKAAELTSHSTEEIHQKVVAMIYYNIATALVLCGPHMRVVIVK